MASRSDSTDNLDSLIQAARGGCRNSLGSLMDLCRPYLLMVAHEDMDPELRSKVGAADLVQETFLEGQKDFATFRGHTQAELLHWFRQILLNNLTNLSRRYFCTDKRQARREVPLDATPPDGSPPWEPIASALSPSSYFRHQEEAHAVQLALERLPERYRQVIHLRHQEYCSFVEIGRRMNRSAEAARKLWFRGIERLRNELRSPFES